MLGRLPHVHEVVLGARRARQQFLEPVLVELLAGHFLQRRHHHFAQLAGDELALAGGDGAVGLVGHLQHHHRAAVFLLEQLEPLHEGEAAGVAEQQQVRRRQLLAGGADVALLEHADVALDVGADILGMALLLGFLDVVAGQLAHAALESVDLGEDRQEVQRPEQLGHVAGDEGVDHLAPALAGLRQRLEVLADHLLLHHHAFFFLYAGVHAATPQSLIESAKVPACSLITWTWPVFSE